jgi:hypothetical protein
MTKPTPKPKSLKDALNEMKKASEEAQGNADQERATANRHTDAAAARGASDEKHINAVIRPLFDEALNDLKAAGLEPRYEPKLEHINIGDAWYTPIIDLAFKHPLDKHEAQEYNRVAHLVFAKIERGIVRNQFGFYATSGLPKANPGHARAEYLTYDSLSMGSFTSETAGEHIADAISKITADSIKARR